MKNKKVLIAMSGGVDSSVAAALMVREGYECIGCTMKLLNQDYGNDTCHSGLSYNAEGAQNAEGSDYTGRIRSDHTCCSLEDVEDARSVARKLGMPYYVFNFASDFSEKVIDRFVRIYQAGGTPNPCIDCNRYMKFDRLYRRARELGCDAVVTGHYARIRFDEESGRWQLLRSKNLDKDQTYVLYSMTQEQLAHTLFPLGEFPDKDQVRGMADQYGFVNSHKPDSQDICFVQSGKYADFIESWTGQRAAHGAFVDEDGNVLGEHKGLIRYTIGQRRGLGLALPAPLYVSRIDTEKNQVVLTPEDRLYSGSLIAEDFNWIVAPPSPGEAIEVSARPRYRAREAAADARVLDGGKVEILFHEPQRALTVGQAVVLYQGDLVVGGGTIAQVPGQK